MIYKVQVEFYEEFFEIENDKIIIGVKSKPVKGEANKEVIKKIAKYFEVSTSQVQIKTGHKSKDKIIEISQ
ncbi:putative ACR protein [Marine Group I thaumarchaeote SCGC AAA799-P11]|uniref:Putative ACR protein n=1 Tax=Marine Group I thaumarchaeote SCGC AAA799-P11 TaxID=1502295 RepID=A0A087S2B4_9ARCH|nr:putative ACR protein [Marine Group I thaumarchaeote SCGC AAA799-P11]